MHVARSRYREQLARLTRHFERDLARTYEFVALAPFAPDPAALRARVNAAPPDAAVSLWHAASALVN